MELGLCQIATHAVARCELEKVACCLASIMLITQEPVGNI